MSDRGQRLRHLGIEFVVIILGVLIALAVDRGVQGMDDEALERSYLESLQQDFTTGAENTRFAIEFIRGRMALIDTLVQTVETGAAPDSMTAEGLARAIELAGWHPGVTFPRVTWEDLNNTGRLALITNGELRRALSDFYVELDFVRDLDATWKSWMEPVQRESGYVLRPHQRLAIARGLLAGAPMEVNPPPIADLVSGLTERPETLRHLGQALLVAELSSTSLEGIVESAQEIVDLLRSELSR